MLNRYQLFGSRLQQSAATVAIAAALSLTAALHVGCQKANSQKANSQKANSQKANPSSAAAPKKTTSAAIHPPSATVKKPTGLTKDGVSIILDGKGAQVKVTAKTAPALQSWSLTQAASAKAFVPLIRALATTPRAARINIHLRGQLTVPFYRALLTSLIQDGRRNLGHADTHAFRGTMTCPVRSHLAKSIALPAGAIVLRTDGLYLNKKRLYTYQAGKTPGHLKRDGDDGYLVDPLYGALESQPRSHVSIVVVRGFTFPSRLLLEIQYTAENVYRAAGKATEPQPHGVSFSVTCGN